jgi:hypothetical protein
MDPKRALMVTGHRMVTAGVTITSPALARSADPIPVCVSVAAAKR